MKTTKEIVKQNLSILYEDECKAYDNSIEWYSKEEIEKVLDDQLPSSFKVPIRRALFGDKK